MKRNRKLKKNLAMETNCTCFANPKKMVWKKNFNAVRVISSSKHVPVPFSPYHTLLYPTAKGNTNQNIHTKMDKNLKIDINKNKSCTGTSEIKTSSLIVLLNCSSHSETCRHRPNITGGMLTKKSNQPQALLTCLLH